MNTEKVNYWRLSTFALALLLVLVGIDAVAERAALPGATRNAVDLQELAVVVIPEKGVALPIRWGDLGARMVETGVIDEEALKELYASRDGMSEEMKGLISVDY